MKVKQLIEMLQALDPEMNIYLDANGLETGLTDLTQSQIIDIVRDYNTEDYNGPHQAMAYTGSISRIGKILDKGLVLIG